MLLHPEGWWARYTPQLWLFPLVVVLGLATLRRLDAAVLGVLIAAVAAVNLFYVARPYIDHAVEYRSEVRADYAQFGGSGEVMAVHIHNWVFSSATVVQLEEAGVAFVEYGSRAELPCESPVELVNEAGSYCPAGDQSTASDG